MPRFSQFRSLALLFMGTGLIPSTWGTAGSTDLSVQPPAQSILRRTFLEPLPQPVNGRMKVAFFDADSTLRITLSGKPSADAMDDQGWT